MAADWHVEYQDPRKEITSQGRLVNVIDVHFVIDTDPAQGHKDMVTLEESRYNADNARALIEEKVGRIKATAAL